MDIRVTNSREKDLDVDTVFANWAKWDFGFLKYRFGTRNEQRGGVGQLFSLDFMSARASIDPKLRDDSGLTGRALGF
jgi:hypothetical protein